MESTITDGLDSNFFEAISEIGIVIQGPLVSRGRTGVTAQIKRRNVKEEHIVNYDCVENIAKLVEKFSGFGKIICVVWSDEAEVHIENLQKLIGVDRVVIVDNITKNIKPKKGILPGNNKYRQFYSSLKGVETVAEHGCKYAIKIRSDQYLDIYDLAKDFLQIKDVRQNFIMVPRIYAGSSNDHLSDFYIGGKTNDLIACFSTYLSAPELFRNVHTDIFYRWASIMLGPSKFPPRILGIKTNMRYITKAWNVLYCPASLSVLQALLWRGDPILINRRKTKFLGDLPADLKVSPEILT